VCTKCVPNCASIILIFPSPFISAALLVLGSSAWAAISQRADTDPIDDGGVQSHNIASGRMLRLSATHRQSAAKFDASFLASGLLLSNHREVLISFLDKRGPA
jgi:hypothetical protein